MPYTEAIAEQLLEDRTSAPARWGRELTTVLRTACLRQRMTAQKPQQVLARIAMLPIDVDRHAVPRRELLALDEALRAAALAAGVGCVGGVA